MKQFRLPALILALALLLSVVAQALTAEQAKELLTRYYIDDLPAAVLEADTVDGVLAALGDPYTEYMTASEYQSFLGSMRDAQTVGIGVQCALEPGLGILILHVYPGSASEGHLLAGDVIISIDGTQLGEMDLDTAAALLRGEEGSGVTIYVQRDGAALAPITLTRTSYTIQATTHTLVDDRIGYILCSTFGPETYGHFRDAIAEMDDASGRWIVDLRGNPGGELNAMADTVGLFAGARDVAYLRDHTGNYYRYDTQPETTTMDPVIVLVDENTASASELFAAAIRNSVSGIVIGSRTYGKGVSQSSLDGESAPEYFPDGDAMKITSYRVFAPNGSTTDIIGVLPDLYLSPEHVEAAALLLCADSPADTAGHLRVHIGHWRWYISLEQAASEGYYPAFVELLEALPLTAELYLGQGGNRWGQMTAAVLAEVYAPEYRARGFSDVTDSPYADQINALAGLEIVRGNERGDFMPNAVLTRAELCALMAQAIGYTGQAASSFSDVAPSAWYAGPVAALQRQGLVQGYGGAFFPDDIVSHEQFMVILARLAVRLNLHANALLQEGMPQEDIDTGHYDAYSDWAQELVWLGDGQYFDAAANIDPHAPTTREEAAASLYIMLNMLGYL